jgi:glycosyltransferase involved in cell wall biosynthesis
MGIDSLTRRHDGVLLVGNFLSNTVGARSVGEDLAARLADSGWGVLSTSDQPGKLRRLLDMVATIWSERHTYNVAQVDVYSGLAFVWAEAACWALRKAGKPYVLTLHGGNLPAFAAQSSRRVVNLLRPAAAVTAPSPYLLEHMRRYRNDICLLPNALEIGLYSFRLRKVASPRLIWLRAFHEIYNPMLAPRVVAALTPDFPEVTLVMVGRDKGDGSFHETQRVAERLGVANRITFPGGVPKTDVPRWLDRGDIFINTANFDNTPISVLEAMACGLCVVSTNVGGIPYLLQHEDNALLVPPDDAEAMSTAAGRVLTEQGLAAQLSASARAKAEQFDWSVVLPQWETLLDRLSCRIGMRGLRENGKLPEN